MPLPAEKEKKRTRTRKVVNPLQRGLACESCRKRKVRCCASKPACSSCRRTAIVRGKDPSKVTCVYPEPSPSQTTSQSKLTKKVPAGKKTSSFEGEVPSPSGSLSASPPAVVFDAATTQLLASFQDHRQTPADYSNNGLNLYHLQNQHIPQPMYWPDPSSSSEQGKYPQQQQQHPIYSASHLQSISNHYFQPLPSPSPYSTAPLYHHHPANSLPLKTEPQSRLGNVVTQPYLPPLVVPSMHPTMVSGSPTSASSLSSCSGYFSEVPTSIS